MIYAFLFILTFPIRFMVFISAIVFGLGALILTKVDNYGRKDRLYHG